MRLCRRRGLGLGVHLELTRVGDGDLLGGLATLRADTLDGLHYVHALDDLAEDDVAPVEPRRLDSADEELRAVCARASVGHREHALTSVLELEVLIGKLLAVDGFAASAVAAGEIATLKHELRDHTVEDRALVVQRLARLAHALLASAESTEVLDSLGDRLAVEAHHDATRGLAIELDVKEDLVGDLGASHGGGESGEEERAAKHFF